jgi:hypothetical protein
MICKHCGAQLPDGASFCTNCGNTVEAPQPQPQPQSVQPMYGAQQTYAPRPAYQQPMYGQTFAAVPVAQPNILAFGILSLALSGIIGLIFGCIARKKGKAYVAEGGQLTGASKVGFILAKAGIIVSIIAIVLSVCYIIFYVLFIAGMIASSGVNWQDVFKSY